MSPLFVPLTLIAPHIFMYGITKWALLYTERHWLLLRLTFFTCLDLTHGLLEYFPIPSLLSPDIRTSWMCLCSGPLIAHPREEG